jgi:hypothetical protein
MALLLNCKVSFSLGNISKGKLVFLLFVVPLLGIVCGLFISFVISNTQSLQQLYYPNNLNDKDLGAKGTSRGRWVFTVTLCVKEKFGNSYKDIPDDKFQEVIDYINFLKENPS